MERRRGSLGSIITAFSLNGVIRELNIARKGIETTMKIFISPSPGVPVFEGFDKRFDRSARRGNVLVGVGVILLVVGFIFQAISTCISP